MHYKINRKTESYIGINEFRDCHKEKMQQWIDDLSEKL